MSPSPRHSSLLTPGAGLCLGLRVRAFLDASFREARKADSHRVGGSARAHQEGSFRRFHQQHRMGVRMHSSIVREGAPGNAGDSQRSSTTGNHSQRGQRDIGSMTTTDPQVPEMPTDFRVDYGPVHARMHAYFRDRAKAVAFAAHHSCDGVAAEVVELFERMGV